MSLFSYKFIYPDEVCPCFIRFFIFITLQKKDHRNFPVFYDPKNSLCPVWSREILFYFSFLRNAFFPSRFSSVSTGINSFTFSDERYHVRTAGDNGCCSLALPSWSHKQYNFSSN